jgi:hypothetical protein
LTRRVHLIRDSPTGEELQACAPVRPDPALTGASVRWSRQSDEVANHGGYSWVLDQAEIATDVVFTTRPHLGAEWPDCGNISVAGQQSDVHWHKRHVALSRAHCRA